MGIKLGQYGGSHLRGAIRYYTVVCVVVCSVHICVYTGTVLFWDLDSQTMFLRQPRKERVISWRSDDDEELLVVWRMVGGLEEEIDTLSTTLYICTVQ